IYGTAPDREVHIRFHYEYKTCVGTPCALIKGVRCWYRPSSAHEFRVRCMERVSEKNGVVSTIVCDVPTCVGLHVTWGVGRAHPYVFEHSQPSRLCPRCVYVSQDVWVLANDAF